MLNFPNNPAYPLNILLGGQRHSESKKSLAIGTQHNDSIAEPPIWYSARLQNSRFFFLKSFLGRRESEDAK